MITVTDIWLDRIVYFKDAHFPVTDNDGFVVITGHNKDSKIAEDQNNGAGKSLLCSAIPTLRYGVAPMAISKNAKKEMLSSAQSSISMAFRTSEDQQVRVTQTRSKWIIEEFDDAKGKYVDTRARTIAIQQENLEKLFPISDIEFYSYAYVQSQKRLGFQDAKPAERLKFITDMFNLNDFDRLKKHFTKMLGLIKDEQTKFSVLESKLLSVNTSLAKLKWNDKKKNKLSKAKDALTYTKEEHGKVSVQLNDIRVILKGLENLNSLELDLETKVADIPNNKPVKDLAMYMRRQIDLKHKADNYRSQLDSYKKQVRRINAKLDGLDSDNLPSLKVLKKEIRKVELRLDDLLEKKSETKRVQRKVSELEDERNELIGIIKELGFRKPSDIDTDMDIDEDISICQTTLKLKSLLDKGESECPTCQQSVDMARISTNVKKAETKLTKLKKLKSARRALVEYEKIQVKWEKASSIYEEKDISSFDSKISSAKKKLASLKGKLDVLRKVKELKEDLECIEQPKAPKELPAEDISIKQAKRIIEQCHNIEKIKHSIQNVYKQHEGLLEVVMEYGIDKALIRYGKKQQKLSKQHRVLTDEHSELIAYCSKMDLKLGEYRVLSKQKLELEGEMSEIQPLLEKRDMYKALEQAYGAKGLKVERADEIVGILEANLNQYAHLIFAEPFTFQVYANEQGISCDVDRGNGKVSDVRLLSGAESDSFRLLFMLSLLIMVPPQRRTNFVVLDEPDSHMDEPTKELFRDQYIPYLRQLVPHVFLITPKNPHFYNDYEHWAVVKEGGVSRLDRNAS